jgi:hypothetical protein
VRDASKGALIDELQMNNYAAQASAQTWSEFIDELYDDVWTLYGEFKAGFKVAGKDEKSYFGLQAASGSRKKQTTYHAKEEPPVEHCCGKRHRTTIPYRSAYIHKPFDFMGLPPEIRSHILQYALAPGMVSLNSCAHHLPRGTTPSLAPGLLSMSRQLKHEVEGLLEENTFIVNVYLHNGTRPTIHRTQLPPHILPKITSLVLVLDTIDIEEGLVDYKYHYDWRQLQALTSLKHLRITGFSDRANPVDVLRWREIIGQIVKRVSASCNIEYGTRSALERQHVRGMARAVENSGCTYYGSNWEEGEEGAPTMEANVEDIKMAAGSLAPDVVQGALSGVVSTSYWRLENQD